MLTFWYTAAAVRSSCCSFIDTVIKPGYFSLFEGNNISRTHQFASRWSWECHELQYLSQQQSTFQNMVLERTVFWLCRFTHNECSLLFQQTEAGQGAAHTLLFIIPLSSEVQIGLKPSSQCAFWQSRSLQSNLTRLIINLLLSNHGRLGQHKATQLNATARDAQEIPMYWKCLYFLVLAGNEIREFTDREDVWSCECQTAISGMCGIPSLLPVLIRLLDLIGWSY